MKLKETVVVEGRDDMSAVLAAVEADIIITHGYGITQKTLENIEAAYKRNKGWKPCFRTLSTPILRNVRRKKTAIPAWRTLCRKTY